jgi:radical SAM protein with 4Fe4S-binding SPASM domain
MVGRDRALQPSVSVVIATYNNSTFLQGCLCSLARQDAPPERFEVIVVDNGSGDDTAAAVERLSGDLPLRYRYHPKQASFETAIARNVGLKMAQGEVLISLADDALVPPDFLRRHADLHQAHRQACLVGTRRFLQRPLSWQMALAQLQTGELAAWAGEQDPHRHRSQMTPCLWLRARAPWALGNWDHLSLRREHLLAVGWFDEWYSIYEEPDYELCYRLFQAGLDFVFEPEPAVYHQYRYRYPRARWRGRGFDYLNYKFKDRRVAVVQAAWRFQDEIEFRGGLVLSPAYQMRLGALYAALSGEPPLDPPSLTIGLLGVDARPAEPDGAGPADGVEAQREQSRELLSAYAATQTPARLRQARVERLREQAESDLLVMAEANESQPLALEETRLPGRPGPLPGREVSLTVRAIEQEIEQAAAAPEIGPIAEGYSYPPRSISFKLTNLCNLRCRMCGQYGLVGNALRQSQAELKQQMDLAGLKQIIDQVTPFRPGMIYVWGGEPFLHPAFTQFIDYIKQQKLFCIVTTNGTRLEATAEALVDSRLDILRVSVDGPAEVHDFIRGTPGLFERVVRGIRAINDRKQATGSSFPLFEIVCTISQDNYRHLETVVSLFEGLGINAITFVHQLYTPPAIGRRHQQFYAQLFDCEAQAWQGFAQNVSGIDGALLGEIIERLERLSGPASISFSPPLRGSDQVAAYYQDLTSLFHDKRCSGPWLWLEVYPNGDVYPCHEFPDYWAGNVLREGFWAVWNGPRFRKFRQQLMLHRGFPGCCACRSQQLVDAFVV